MGTWPGAPEARGLPARSPTGPTSAPWGRRGSGGSLRRSGWSP